MNKDKALQKIIIIKDDKNLIEKLIEIVRSVREIILNGKKEITEKGYADFVTDADLKVQEAITKKLKEEYPSYLMIGEESGLKTVTDEPTFILDPIDGTTNFMYGLGLSAVSLGLSVCREIVAGIVYEPVRDEVFYAEKGKGAFLNKNRININPKKQLKDCLIAIGTAPYKRNDTAKRFDIFKRVFDASLDIRRLGSAAIDLCYTACGRLDGFFEENLKVWDYAAGMVIIKEAGGIVTGFDGAPQDLNAKGDIVAGNPQINSQLVKIIKDIK